MSHETKNRLELPTVITDLSRQAGMLLMVAAVSFGMLDHTDKRVIIPGRVAFAPASEREDQNSPLRRESEETAPHYISYSETQRTPARSGRI